MNGEYKTVKRAASASFTERRSEFIGSVSPCESEEQALDLINAVRAEHRKAAHNCYAYILRFNHTARHSDDGEPSGTAGVPIYDVFDKAGVTDLCCVVTRYFGGILLGAGGLVRAYSNAASLALEAAGIKCPAPAALFAVTVDYSDYGKVTPLIAAAEAREIKEDFGARVRLDFILREERREALVKNIADATRGKAKVEISPAGNFDFGE